MSWRRGQRRVSVLAEMALRRERIAARLGELRERDSLTQEQAAARVGVTLRQWQRWEYGESVPYPRNMDQIATKFGISVVEFFDEELPAHHVLEARVELLEGEITELRGAIVALSADALRRTREQQEKDDTDRRQPPAAEDG